MQKRRSKRTRVLIIDGEVHLIVERDSVGIRTQRLRGRLRNHALRLIESWQSDVEAHAVGLRGRG